MVLQGFHPIVRRWFTETLGEPTRAQERGWASVASGCHTLIAAPTGSGKTLAGFLTALDDLFREGLERPLVDEVRVVYVSPLKALSADIHRNLAEPRRGIRDLAEAEGLPAPRITAAVRTGDTTQAERSAMLRKPPHILVTTPESLYLLLTAARSRELLRTARTVIVDEIHAVIGTRRGAHLALSLERLQRVAREPLLRLGLSATQKPIEDVARFLVGADERPCRSIDEGHRREMDLEIDIPASPLDAVMSHEVWEEYYDRLAELVRTHRTTLIFVNTRRMAERITRHLSDRLGDAAVAAHHGSLAKERRLDAETRLKTGQLGGLVATASLELGIDIGFVDLVCQIGSPHRIGTLLQRVGRSGHSVAGRPKGRLFPVSKDDLAECAALLRSIRCGELDAVVRHDAPLDVLAQQIVAECSACESSEDDLFALVRRAGPYRDLARKDFDAVLTVTAEGFSTRRGRRAALVHRDEVNGRVRGRRGSRLLAQTSGGAIPEVADYRVLLEPDETFIGTVNEDFAIESMAGDVFQLGNASWRVIQVGRGTVRVSDARGTPPNIPFWFGEAPARSDELSGAVSELRGDMDRLLTALEAAGAPPDQVSSDATEWLMTAAGISRGAAEQIAEHLSAGRRTLGVIPTQQTLVLERFFDESGGTQLVLHAPFGSRINKAWGLALRKRFCRQFNFELQAAATDDALMLSLGPQHSFPLADVFRYLHPETTRDVLVQAFLDAPVFQTRWRWNTTIALAVPRNRGGRKIPPQLQRMLADDLMASAFPDAAACLENIPGDRQVPDHPLVDQTVRDCLQEAMDFEGLRAILRRIHAGELRLVARDTPEPSVFADEILNAKPYAFLDDAPLEERRSHAVQTRRPQSVSSNDIGALDRAAIERVRDEQRPDPRDADELHDALMICGFLIEGEDPIPIEHLRTLGEHRRAAWIRTRGRPVRIAVAAERVPEWLAVHPDATPDPPVRPPAARARAWERTDAITELVRARLTLLGPVTSRALGTSLDASDREIDTALLGLESEGVVLRGRFTPGATDTEWCDRALLARIHRYTLNRLRAEIEPVTPAVFMRFLFAWQHVEPATRLMGLDGLREVLTTLDGLEVPARAWERSILTSRVSGYEPQMLDLLCLMGEVGWARISAPGLAAAQPVRPVSATPIALFLREHGALWQTLRCDARQAARTTGSSADALRVLELLRARGASFFAELKSASALDHRELLGAIGALVARGLVTCDSFSGLRSLMAAARHQPVQQRAGTLGGRWTALPVPDGAAQDEGGPLGEAAIDLQARALLRRYGVVFRRLLAREPAGILWRELIRVYRRLEARGEIRGGRFVTGMSGEQFALPDAVERLREARRTKADGQLLTIGTADPLNLAGLVTPGERIRSSARSRMIYRDGVPLAVMEGDEFRGLIPLDASTEREALRVLVRQRRAAARR